MFRTFNCSWEGRKPQQKRSRRVPSTLSRMQPQEYASCRTRARDAWTHRQNKLCDTGCDILIFSLLFYLDQLLVTTPPIGRVILECFTMVSLTNVEVEGSDGESRWGALPGVVRGGCRGGVGFPGGRGTPPVIPVGGKEMRLEEVRLNM